MRVVCRLMSLACIGLLLASCTTRSSVPPADVLSRAARVTRDLQSARFTVNATFEVALPSDVSARGTLGADGRMQDAGRQLQFTFQTNGQTMGGDRTTWHVQGDVMVAGEQEVYAFIRDVTVRPPHPLLQPALLGPFLGTWWRLPPGSSATTTGPTGVTPDPRFLRMQAEVVDVVRDRGIETFHDRTAHHYDVTLNREKLVHFLEEVARERGQTAQPETWRKFVDQVEAAGELWIDAEEYFIRGVQWTLTMPGQANPFTLTLRVELRDFHQADPIVPPTDAQNFPANPLEGFQGILDAPAPGIP